MLFCCLQYQANFLSPGSLPEQHNHDQSMRKSDFGAIDCAITGGFEDSKDGCQIRIEDDGLCVILSSC